MEEAHYRFVTTEANLTLHESMITQANLTSNLVLTVDSLDVYADHSLNPIGRHQVTGPAEIELVQAYLVDSKQIYVSEGFQVSLENFKTYSKIEILSFEFEPSNQLVKIYCEIEHIMLVEYHIHCEQVYYKWNALQGDAWFQDWPASADSASD